MKTNITKSSTIAIRLLEYVARVNGDDVLPGETIWCEIEVALTMIELGLATLASRPEGK